MKLIESVQTHISKLELKTFYIYCATIAALMSLFIIVITIRFYSKINDIKRAIESVNEQREEVQKILGQSSYVKKQREKVDEILKQDENFRIGGYFKKDILEKLNLEQKKSVEYAPQHHSTPDPKYEEVTLSAEFSGVDMKEVCELLNTIDENERIYTKELSIAQSKKIPQKLDVSLTIATLQPQETAAQ